jgi:hypothetical protein
MKWEGHVQTRIETTATAKEAARVTGVDPNMQAELRAQGVLSDGWGTGARIGFSDLCRLYALKRFLDSKFVPACIIGEFGAGVCAQLSVLPMMHFAQEVSIRRYGAVAEPWVATKGHSIGRYVVVEGERACRCDTLADYERGRDEAAESSVLFAFDCKAAAEELIDALGRPAYEIRND